MLVHVNLQGVFSVFLWFVVCFSLLSDSAHAVFCRAFRMRTLEVYVAFCVQRLMIYTRFVTQNINSDVCSSGLCTTTNALVYEKLKIEESTLCTRTTTCWRLRSARDPSRKIVSSTMFQFIKFALILKQSV